MNSVALLIILLVLQSYSVHRPHLPIHVSALLKTSQQASPVRHTAQELKRLINAENPGYEKELFLDTQAELVWLQEQIDQKGWDEALRMIRANAAGYRASHPRSSSGTPSAVAEPTPFPVPVVEPDKYLPKVEGGPTIRVSSATSSHERKGSDLGALINAADAQLTKLGGGTISISGGGSIRTQVILHHHTVFDASEYSCDVPSITDQGQFLIADGVLVEGVPAQWDNEGKLLKDGTRILEPTFFDRFPAVEVFQALGDTTGSHTGAAQNITVQGFHIVGRQQHYDGGVRSTILFGNCTNCMARDIYLEDTASLGITFGGSGSGTGNHAKHGLVYHVLMSGVAAANVACVNCEDFILTRQIVLRPGHHNPPFGGGVSGFDLETNSAEDWASDIFVFNNYYNYEGAWQDGAGSAIVMQSPFPSRHAGNILIANNRVIGGIAEPDPVPVRRYLTSCFFINQLNNVEIIANYCFKAGQAGLQWYGGRKGLVQDNFFDRVGGGGAPAISLTGVMETIFRRNHFDPYYQTRAWLGTRWSTSTGISDPTVTPDPLAPRKCKHANVYEGNYMLSTGQFDVQPGGCQ